MSTHQRILTKDRRRKKAGRSSLDSHNSSRPDRDGWYTAADKSEVDNTIDLDLLPPKKAKKHKRRIDDSSSDDGGGGSDTSRDAWGNKGPSTVSTRRIINKVNKRSKKRRRLQLSSESEESNDDDEDNSVVFVAEKTSRSDKSRRMDKKSGGKAKRSNLKPSESNKKMSKSGQIDRRSLARLRRSIDSAGERHIDLSRNASTGRGQQLPAKAREAGRIALPGPIDAVDQLVWYRMVLQNKPDEYEARYRLNPCRILEGDEAERQRSNLRADSDLTIVQFLHWRGKYLRLCVSASSSALTRINENLQTLQRAGTKPCRGMI